MNELYAFGIIAGIFIIFMGLFWSFSSDRNNWVCLLGLIFSSVLGVSSMIYCFNQIQYENANSVEDYRVACHELGGVVEDFNDGDWYQCIKRGYKLIEVPGY